MQELEQVLLDSQEKCLRQLLFNCTNCAIILEKPILISSTKGHSLPKTFDHKIINVRIFLNGIQVGILTSKKNTPVEHKYVDWDQLDEYMKCTIIEQIIKTIVRNNPEFLGA